MAIKVPIVTEYNSKGVSDAQRAMERFGVKSSSELKKAAAGFAVLGVAGVSAFKSMDAGYDAVIAGTGATGKALERLKDDADSVGRKVPNSFESVGVAIAEVNTRLGSTGAPLQDMTKRFLDLSRVTKVDVKQGIGDVTRVFGDWSVAAEDQARTLDTLFAATQLTGIGVDKLSQSVVQFGAPLRQMGFSLEESIALFGKFEKEGVNTEAIMSGMRQGLGRMATAGEEPVETFQRLVEEIKNAGSTGEANAIALKAFGQRAGPDMAAAIREGRFELADMVDTLADSEGALDTAAEATLSANDRMKMFGNQLMVSAIPAIELFAKVADLAGAGLTRLPKPIQSAVVALGVLAVVSKSARHALKAFGLEAKSSATKAGALGVASGAAGLALVALGLNAARSAKESKKAAAALDDLTRASDDRLVRQFGVALSAGVFAADDFESSLANIARTSPGVLARMLELEDASGGLTSQFVDQGLSVEEATVWVDRIRQAYDDEQVSVANAASTMEAATDSVEDHSAEQARLASEIQETVSALEAEAEALAEQADAMHASADANFGLMSAALDWSETLAENTKIVNTSGVSHHDLTAAQIATTRSASDLAAAAREQAVEQAAANGVTLSSAEGQSVWNASMVDSARQANGPLRDAIFNYIATANGIPVEKVTAVLADIDEMSVEDAQRALDEASVGRTVRIDADTHAANAKINALISKINGARSLAQIPTPHYVAAPEPSHVGSRFAAGETKMVVPGQVFTPDRPGRLASVEESGRLTDTAQVPARSMNVTIEGATDPAGVKRALEDMWWQMGAK